MNNIQLPSSGGIEGGGMGGRGLGRVPEAPAKGQDCSAARFAPGAWLVLEARFPQPLLDGESESEGRDPLGEQAKVAAVTRDSIWIKFIGVNTRSKATNPYRGEASLLRCGMGVTTSIVGKRVGWKPD